MLFSFFRQLVSIRLPWIPGQIEHGRVRAITIGDGIFILLVAWRDTSMSTETSFSNCLWWFWLWQLQQHLSWRGPSRLAIFGRLPGPPNHGSASSQEWTKESHTIPWTLSNQLCGPWPWTVSRAQYRFVLLPFLVYFKTTKKCLKEFSLFPQILLKGHFYTNFYYGIRKMNLILQPKMPPADHSESDWTLVLGIKNSTLWRFVTQK